MKKNLILSKKNSTLALGKTKSLLDITNKLLAKKNSDLVDDGWIDRLWEWADENDINETVLYYLRIDEYYEPFGGYINPVTIIIKEMSEQIVSKRTDDIKYVNWIYETHNYTDVYDEIYVNILKTGISKNKKTLLNTIVLDLSDNNLIKLSKDIFFLKNIEILSLKNNELEVLSKEILNLDNLTALDLQNNKLKFLSQDISSLPLKILLLNKNKLKELPKEIGDLSKLSYLDLSENDLIKLPNEIINLFSLQSFELRFNPNLVLTKEQKEWVKKLRNNGCYVWIDDDLLDKTIDKNEIPF